MIDARKKAPVTSLIVVVPANHSISPERVAERTPETATGDLEVIVACAGQPADLATIQTQLRSAQFLLAPAGTSADDLRALALSQTSADIVTLVSGVPIAPGTRPERKTPPGQRVVVERGPLALSVIVPVHNAGRVLGETLAAIVASDLARDSYEVIVVDDSSDDDSVAVGSRHADMLVRLPGGPRGAAYARNRGADVARGEVLAFINADVHVARDTLSRLLAALAGDSSLAAVGTANDGSTAEQGLAAHYWNLVQQYGALTYGGRGIHFSASCGAVRRAAFAAVGGFNEWVFSRASLEGLDLGSRLHAGGRGVLLSRDITVSHAHRHDVRSILSATWRHSSALVRCLGYRRTRTLAHSHRLHALSSPSGLVAAAASAVTIVAAALARVPWMVPAATGLAALGLLATAPLQRYFVQVRGNAFALAVAPLHFATQLVGAVGMATGWALRNLIGDPAPEPTTQAFAEVGVTMWPPVPKKQ